MPPLPQKPLSEMTDSEKLSYLIILLTGHPLDTNDKGMVGDVHWLKAQVWILKRFKDRALAWIAGGVAIGSFFTTLIFFLISYFKK